jgi:hypothetical protein
MERDELRPDGGDMGRDLEEKESSAHSFGVGQKPRPNRDTGGGEAGTMGDSRPDRSGPGEAHFVDASDDPNMRISRRTSELTELEREGAEERIEIRHDDSTVYAKPMGALQEEGGELGPRKPDGEQS